MRDRALLLVFLALFSTSAHAQIVWQPTPPPEVTAENARWFQSGEPIDWNGGLYYPAGPDQFFNRYQMVRSGSFRGIPLYTDTTLQLNSIVFVPLPGQRMRPYERPRTGVLAGTTGSRTPSFPPDIASQARSPEGLNQAPSAPYQAPAYDLGTPTPLAPDASSRALPMPIGTSGRVAATPAARRVTSLRPPTGANAIWINFDGRRWVSGGKTIDYDAANLTEVGKYHGWSVYIRNGDRSTIYVPSMAGKLAPYTRR
jgi:hypothetical protein